MSQGTKRATEEEKGRMQSARHGVSTWEAKEGGGGHRRDKDLSHTGRGKGRKGHPNMRKQLFEVL